jgi:hypothetical protein
VIDDNEQMVKGCFRTAGDRLRQGLPFCHPGPCQHPEGAVLCEWEIGFPDGVWTLNDGTKIPLTVTYMVCAEHQRVLEGQTA